MLDESQKLTEIINLTIEISRYKDVDLVLERILTLTRKFTSAEAGSIYVREGDKLHFSYTQNDVMQQRLGPGKKLVFATFTIPISPQSISGYAASSGEMLNIPDVYTLPSDVPYTFNKDYDELSKYRTQSMLTFPLKTARGETIGVLQLINAKNSEGQTVPFSISDEPMIKHFAANAAVALERAQMTRAMILRVNSMAELRDPKETGAHVNRVAAYSAEIFENWAVMKNMPPDEIQRERDFLRMGAMMHDVGKVAISDSILKKPGKLDPQEYETMKTHTYLGARLFLDKYSELDDSAAIIALNHHEKWDGTGYPGHIDITTGLPLPGYETENGKARGKKGEEIPAFGRVVAIADVYDALSSRRSYKAAWTEDDVIENIKSEAGKQFDPDMVEAFLSCIDVLRSISKRYNQS